MTCQEFWDHLPELERADGGDARLQHTLECQACAAMLKKHRALETGLKQMAADSRHLQAPDRVETALLAAFRTQSRSVARVAARGFWIPALTWAAAAAVLITAALFLLQPRRPMPVRHSAPSVVETASFETTDTDATTDSDGFIPLPNAEKLDPNDDVNVVRVEVPRSAMMAVGLEVAVDRVSELVEADVKLGPDGMARAIRFVDEE
jgi:hypothetical protein